MCGDCRPTDFADPPYVSASRVRYPSENASASVQFDVVEFFRSLEAGNYNIEHSLHEWTSGDLARLDSLLGE